MNLLIGIPAFNEEEMIERVIKSLPRKIRGIKKVNILVVDDGSSDETFNKAMQTGVFVMKHLLNRGLGGALKTIFSFAREKKYDILVTFDADGQHLASDIERIIQPIVNKQASMVIGTRWRGGYRKNLPRYLINLLANVMTFLLFGIWSSDTQSGLRAFDKIALEKFNIVSDGMEVSSELFKEIGRHKLAYKEVSIRALYTDYSKSKGQQIHNAPDVFFQLLMRLWR